VCEHLKIANPTRTFIGRRVEPRQSWNAIIRQSTEPGPLLEGDSRCDWSRLCLALDAGQFVDSSALQPSLEHQYVHSSYSRSERRRGDLPRCAGPVRV